jgi:hypothetical protein
VLRKLSYQVITVTVALVAMLVFSYGYILLTDTDVGPEVIVVLQLTAITLAVTLVMALVVLRFTADETLDIE